MLGEDDVDLAQLHLDGGDWIDQLEADIFADEYPSTCHRLWLHVGRLNDQRTERVVVEASSQSQRFA